jgi:acid phosphatase type 7
MKRTVLLLAIAALALPARAAAVDETIAAVGDTASCATNLDDTSAAAASWLNPTATLTLGDNAYPDGSVADFQNCWYTSLWRWHEFRLHPSPGNHEYHTTGAAGYFDYFASRGVYTGWERGGYYSFDIGTWHLVSLNSEIDHSAGSAQVAWLKSDLAAHPTKCTLAYWHRPLFSSGAHGNELDIKPLWDALYAGGADIVLNGHDHDYERFAAQNPSGGAESGNPGVGRGITEFVVGTGGASRTSFSSVRPNSVVRHVGEGVLYLYLHDVWAGWRWQSAGNGGDWFTDWGSQWCH